MHEPMTYHATLSYLYGLQKFGIKFRLANISYLLATLNHPQKNLPCIHIAGTNGKGSTSAFIASMLSYAGYRVGHYTSPHLINFTERIKINTCEISKKDVVRLTTLLRKKEKAIESITFFEFVTAMALCYFAEQKVDVAVIEVGMGGRLDATNVVSPLVSIITNIAREHEFYLGNSLTKIAKEKAGIIKKKSVVITGATQPRVLSLFIKRCYALHVPLYQLGKDFLLTKTSLNVYQYHGLRHSLQGIKIGLVGDHQTKNASLALAAIEILNEKGYYIDDSKALQGLRYVSWPGRLETVHHLPCVLLDGAHNPAAMESLRQALLQHFVFKKLILVLGIMADKNIKGMMNIIVPIADKVILCTPHLDRAASTHLLSQLLDDYNVSYHQVEEVRDAIRYALSIAHPQDVICVTGSLFTVGEARSMFLQPKRFSPMNRSSSSSLYAG